MTETLSTTYPVLPLRDIVVFPHMIVPLFVGREKSVRALEAVMADDRQILLASQIDPAVDELAAALAAKSPATMKLGRDSFYAVWDQGADEALRLLHPMLTITSGTEDAAEGIAAFVEKRPPVWKGR